MAQLRIRKTFELLIRLKQVEILKQEYDIRGTGELPPESLALFQKVL